MLKFGRIVYAIDLADADYSTKAKREHRKEQRRALRALGVPLIHATREAADKAIQRVWAARPAFEVKVFEQTPVSF